MSGVSCSLGLFSDLFKGLSDLFKGVSLVSDVSGLSKLTLLITELLGLEELEELFKWLSLVSDLFKGLSLVSGLSKLTLLITELFGLDLLTTDVSGLFL